MNYMMHMDNLFEELKQLGYYEHMIHEWMDIIDELDDWEPEATVEKFAKWYSDRV